jgi:hypothetical protein
MAISFAADRGLETLGGHFSGFAATLRHRRRVLGESARRNVSLDVR